MTAQYRHDGNAIDWRSGTALAAGDAVDVLFEMVGIVVQAMPADATVEGALRVDGVFEMTKTTAADVMAVGDPVTITPGGSATVTAVVGPHRVVQASAANALTVWVKINTGMPEA